MPALIAFILFIIALPAAAEPLPDGAVFADMYGACLRELIPAPEGDSLRTASVSFEGPIRTSPAVRTRAEAILTALGYTIAEPAGEYGISIEIEVTEARIAFRREMGGYGRHFTLGMHARGTGRDGVTRFARGNSAARSDVIPASSIRATDTAPDFAPAIGRTDAGGKPGRIMIVSFLVLAAALGWFALR